MITANEAGRYRSLWAGVALAALLDFHTAIKRVKRKGGPEAIQREVDAARRYIEGRGFAEVCDLAGVTIRPADVMEKLEAGTMQFNLTAGRDVDRRRGEEAA